MEFWIVDSTLRDGEQTAGVALSVSDKLEIARMLDRLGIYQIEAGIPVMEGSEKKSVAKIAELGLKSRISAWNRMNIQDIRHSMDCGVDILHISVPTSDLHIQNKLHKERKWVEENLRKCLEYAAEQDYEITIGLEDASRADLDFIIRIIEIAGLYKVQRVRYADTVGVMYRKKVMDEISWIKAQTGKVIEFHAHNDLGMAVSNSIAALRAGAEVVDCTIGGLGERAGNCNYLHFIEAAKGYGWIKEEIDIEWIKEIQERILQYVKPHAVFR